MPVTKEITHLEQSNVKLMVTVPKEDVRSQYQDILKDFAKNMQIPGFRKGKVPQDVLERKFGEALREEALGKIIEKAVGEVFEDQTLPKDEKPLPYSQPRMDEAPKLDFDEDLCFSVIYDVLPNVNIGTWKGLEVEVPDVSVTEDDLMRELDEVRERNAFVLDRDDNEAARNSDVVTVNHCELDDNNEVLPDSERKDFAFTLGKGNNAYMFDDDIAGMKKGETREFTKTYPNDDQQPGMFAGLTKKFRVTLTALKEKKLPDLDDELAQDVDEKFTTLDDLKKSIQERLEKNLEQRIRDLTISNVLEKIMENTPVTLPESMIRVELDGRLRNLARRFGTDVDGIMQMLTRDGKGLDDIQGQWRPSAEKALHSRLIIETLMDEQGIKADDEDVEREMEKMAADYGESVDDIYKRFGEGNSLEYIKEDIRERKIFDIIIAGNTIKKGSRLNYLDLMANNW